MNNEEERMVKNFQRVKTFPSDRLIYGEYDFSEEKLKETEDYPKFCETFLPSGDL